jgi:hypothetical protein
MIGQVTPIAMTNIQYRFYYIFVDCNFTNALFFYLLLPETKKVPLEVMNQMFSNAPWIVPGSKREDYMTMFWSGRLRSSRLSRIPCISRRRFEN